MLPPAPSLLAAAVAEPQKPDLFRKLLLLAGVRLLVGTALLIATAVLSLGPGEAFPHRAEALLYAIIGSIYLGSLISVFFLRSRRYLLGVALAQIVGDVVAATGLVYLTGGAESIFTILYPLAIVNAAIGLSRKGAVVGALLSAASFCLLSAGMERGFVPQPFSALDRAPLPTSRFLLTLAANLSAFLLTAALSAYLAEALQGARTQLKEVEIELEALAALHQSIVRSIASGILTTGDDGRITYLNPYGEEITGLKLREVRGEPLQARFPELAAALAERGRGEAVLGGTRVVGFTVAQLADPDTPGHVLVLQDLTELRRMEQAVRRADRLATVGRLAAGLAHEIRNPLASMCGSIELLGAAHGLSDKDRRLMKIVLREGERLEALVRDFLAFARPSQPQLVRVDASGLIEDTLAVFQQEARTRGLAIDAQVERAVAVSADAALLKQVLWNLLSNAADASPPGGRLRVRLGREAGEVVLRVEDEGQGIAPDDLGRIFEPFFTTKERGTGLGLAIVHRIVEAHAGHVAVDSAPGRGAVFTVRLPEPAEPRAAG